MQEPKLFRQVAAMALAMGLLLTVAGCADKKPPTEDKKGDASRNTTNPPLSINSNTTPSNDNANKPPPTPITVEKIDLNVGVGLEAINFITSLKNGVVKPEQLSQGFLRAIGVPVVFPGDKAKGYSADAATSLLVRALTKYNLGLPAISKQVGDVALFRGLFSGDTGGYCLRMIHEAGAWKVDWLSLSSVAIQGAELNTSSPDIASQEFTVAAVIGVFMDKDALVKEDRAIVLAAGLTPALKKKWAEPLDSDKAEGFDYNRGLLAQKTASFSAGVESFALSHQGSSTDFRVEATMTGGAKKAYLVKLVKGTGTGQWFVDDVLPQ